MSEVVVQPNGVVERPRREGEPKKTRLGRGLGALLGEYLPDEGEGAAPLNIRSVPVARIASNPFQPRKDFAPEQLAELETSIRENGLLQPLVVRPALTAADGVQWELVAGERRWRVVRQLGWGEVPVVVKEVDDRTMLILAVVENVQREELSPLEEALAYRQLVDQFGLTQRQIAQNVGRERSTVANLMRLLALPASVQRLVNEGTLSMGHARAILGAGDERRMAEIAREAVARNLTVRAVEERVRAQRSGGAARSSTPPAEPEGDGSTPHLRHLETELQRALGTAARIRIGRGESGRIEIPFYNADDFDRVVELLLGPETR